MDEKAMDRKTAIGSYEKAADCYKADGHSDVTASQLRIKAADLRLQEGDYDNAIKVYEDVRCCCCSSCVCVCFRPRSSARVRFPCLLPSRGCARTTIAFPADVSTDTDRNVSHTTTTKVSNGYLDNTTMTTFVIGYYYKVGCCVSASFASFSLSDRRARTC